MRKTCKLIDRQNLSIVILAHSVYRTVSEVTMTAFVMKGYKGKTVGCAMSHTPLEVKGSWHLQGRMPVGGDGAPEWVYSILLNNPDIESVSIQTKTGGRVYSR